MEKKITKKKKPTITGLTRELREYKQRNDFHIKQLEDAKINISSLIAERDNIESSLVRVNIEAAKQGNELSETKMWFGKAQQTIIELNETITQLNIIIQEHHNSIDRGALVPREKAVRFFLVDEKYLSYTIGNILDTDIVGRELTIEQATEFNRDLWNSYSKECAVANKFRNLLREGKLMWTSDALVFIERSKRFMYKMKNLLRREQSLHAYAVEHNEV